MTIADAFGAISPLKLALSPSRLAGLLGMALCALTVLGLATSAAGADLIIGTFNAEFLTRPNVHRKFGLPLKLKGPAKAQWSIPGFRNSRFKEATQNVARFLATIDVDIWALTEVGSEDDVRELVQELQQLGATYPNIAVCQCTDTLTRQHVAVLSKLPLSDIFRAVGGREGYDTELDDPETERHTGLSKAIRVQFRAAGHTFHLYVVHLASEAGGHERDTQRIAQASIIRRHYLPLLLAGEHVIVAGDMNDHRGQPALRRLRGRDDIWEDLIQTGNVKHFDRGLEGTRWTYDFQGERRQIDHVLLSNSIDQIARKVRTRVPDQTDPAVSDHRPMVVTINLR